MTIDLITQRALVDVEEDAGDDEHCRHRQHVCKRLRGRPLGGFPHVVSPPGLDIERGHGFSLRKIRARHRQNFHSERPTIDIRVLLKTSPHSANINDAKLE